MVSGPIFSLHVCFSLPSTSAQHLKQLEDVLFPDRFQGLIAYLVKVLTLRAWSSPLLWCTLTHLVWALNWHWSHTKGTSDGFKCSFRKCSTTSSTLLWLNSHFIHWNILLRKEDMINTPVATTSSNMGEESHPAWGPGTHKRRTSLLSTMDTLPLTAGATLCLHNHTTWDTEVNLCPHDETGT